MSTPLISVVIPAYNCADTIGQAIRSALSQEVAVEILIIDDHSTQDLSGALGEFLVLPQVRYLRNEENLGPAKCRNIGVAAARGAYIAFLDADDYWDSSKLKKQLALMEETGCVLCCTGRELLTAQGLPTGRILGVTPQITYRQLLRHNCIGCSSVLLTADAARKFPMEHADSHEDYITWMCLLRHYGTACGIDQPLMKYRLSSTGKSGSKLRSAAMTYRAYRYAGFGVLASGLLFCRYAFCGVKKYALAGRGGKHEA